MNEYYVIDTGDLMNGQHVSDEDNTIFYQNIELAESHFELMIKSLSNRRYSYVYLLKYVDDKCLGIIRSFYIN